MLSIKILLDRSGSMTNRWKTTIDSINEYVAVIKDSGVEAKITFVAFDTALNPYVNTMQWGAISSVIAPIVSSSVLEVVRSDVSIDKWVPLTGQEVTPRGSTPLFDAVVEMKDIISRDMSSKGIFLIMTDGAENASKNNKASAEKTVSYVKERGWEVVFLGANFDVTRDATSLGIGSSNFAEFSDVNAVQTMSLTGTKSVMYATRGVAMGYTDSEKASMKSK